MPKYTHFSNYWLRTSVVIHVYKARARRNGYRMFISVYIMCTEVMAQYYNCYSFFSLNLFLRLTSPNYAFMRCRLYSKQKVKEYLDFLCFLLKIFVSNMMVQVSFPFHHRVSNGDLRE